MKKIPTDKIEDGMVLAKPLIGSGGNVLLNENIVLKQAMISRLKNWGIPFVAVQSEQESPEEEDAPVPMGHRSDELKAVFSDVMGHPIMKLIYETTRKHLQAGNGS